MAEIKLALSDKISREITPDMIGLFFEDINFGADGGLYAELLENRSFEAVKTRGGSHNYVLREDNLYAWSSTDKKEENLEISFNEPVSEKNPHYLRFTAEKAGEGFANKAYDGLYLKKGEKYKVSFYAREVEYAKGKIKIAVTKAGKSYGETEITFNNGVNPPKEWIDTIHVVCDTKEWEFYEGEIIPTQDLEGGLFEVHLTEPGCVEFDLISLMPENAVAGVFRKDLFQALKELQPAFLRFPGGCIVEGTSIMHRYQWKNTVGPLKDRKINTNLWAVQGGNTLAGTEIPDCHYMQSYGIGFYEYFLLCEMLSGEKRKCKPLPVVNIGVACQFRSYEVVPFGTDDFNQYVQDALDLIEFANGPVTSKWGKLRADMGHPESFNMEMIGIGNEQWESGVVDLSPRYKAFEKAIHEKYPEIKCIGTAGPFIKNEMYDQAWDFYHKEAESNKKIAYAVDEHYYVAPQWLYDNVALYDDYPRDVSVFAGEYAAHDDNLSNSMEAAVAEAAMMTGMERNGDLVKLASYAPLFNRIGHSHWTPDMIWFDSEKVVLTPTYYVQKLFSTNSGSQALELNNQEKTLRESKLYVSAVKNDDGDKILKIANGSTEALELSLTDEKDSLIMADAEVTVLMAKSGKAKEIVPTKAITVEGGNKAVSVDSMTNLEVCELRAPEEVSCVTEQKKLSGKITIPAKSFVVVKI